MKTLSKFTHGSLFSGIGGFDIAAEWMGWENLFHCEWNDFGKKILKYYWPNSISYDDITKTDFTIHRGAIDILSGGFPCQPYSVAGKRRGKDDERHLWPEMLRAIREIQPSYVVGENVGGLVSWNGGMVFNEVQTQLEAQGYEVQPFILPACAVNAPHRRDRVWVIAYRTDARLESVRSERKDTIHGLEVNADTDCTRPQKQYITTESNRQEYGSRIPTEKWANFPTQSPICSGDDGVSFRLDGITFSKWRNESIKAYGNAIVPQVALEIFKAIGLHNDSLQQQKRANETK